MFPADTLYLVLFSPAESLSHCTMSLPGAVLPFEHDPDVWTSLHVSCHTLESLPITDSWALDGLGTYSHSVLYVQPVHRPIVDLGHGLYKLVLSASRTSFTDAFLLWLSWARIDSHEHSRMLSPSTPSLSLTAGVTTAFACCRFSGSTTLSQCLLSGKHAIPLSCHTMFLCSMTSD